ncbi:hypothetical protein ACIO87_38205 [Streptomyces sp. NPDC087218]|uniref:hypothetical protein n=1 Tax=Streptomyces sp. NPDC087218 TaxID=3365769 RepID=UPI00382C4275
MHRAEEREQRPVVQGTEIGQQEGEGGDLGVGRDAQAEGRHGHAPVVDPGLMIIGR